MRIGLFATPDQQTIQHSSHYQHARTHICSHFSHGLLEFYATITNWNHVTRTAPKTISQLFPPVSALFTNFSIDILSRDTPAVTG